MFNVMYTYVRRKMRQSCDDSSYLSASITCQSFVSVCTWTPMKSTRRPYDLIRPLNDVYKMCYRILLHERLIVCRAKRLPTVAREGLTMLLFTLSLLMRTLIYVHECQSTERWTQGLHCILLSVIYP